MKRIEIYLSPDSLADARLIALWDRLSAEGRGRAQAAFRQALFALIEDGGGRPRRDARAIPARRGPVPTWHPDEADIGAADLPPALFGDDDAPPALRKPRNPGARRLPPSSLADADAPSEGGAAAGGAVARVSGRPAEAPAGTVVEIEAARRPARPDAGLESRAPETAQPSSGPGPATSGPGASGRDSGRRGKSRYSGLM